MKKLSTLKSQIEMYKKTIHELHIQVFNEEMKFKKLELEFKETEETHRLSESILRSENDEIQKRLVRLKETHELMLMNSQTFQYDGKIIKSLDDLGNQIFDGPFSSAELSNIPSEIKEKVIRLYHENKELKSKENDFVQEQLHLLQSLFDDEKQRNADLIRKLNETSNTNLELECQLIIIELKLKLSQMQMRIDQVVKLGEEKNEIIEEKNKELHKKQREIEDCQNKLKNYLEKAKIVIKSSLSGSIN